jgi:hypothetical protein
MGLDNFVNTGSIWVAKDLLSLASNPDLKDIAKQAKVDISFYTDPERHEPDPKSPICLFPEQAEAILKEIGCRILTPEEYLQASKHPQLEASFNKSYEECIGELIKEGLIYYYAHHGEIFKKRVVNPEDTYTPEDPESIPRSVSIAVRPAKGY